MLRLAVSRRACVDGSNCLPKNYAWFIETRIILDCRDSCVIRFAQKLHSNAIVKSNRAQIGRSCNSFDVPATMLSSEFHEMPKKLFSKALPSSRCSDSDEVHITNRFDLRDKAEQVSNHFGANTNYKGRVAKLIDKHRMVKRTSVPTIPKILQLLENLVVILLRARRNFLAHSCILPQLATARDVIEMTMGFCCGARVRIWQCAPRARIISG